MQLGIKGPKRFVGGSDKVERHCKHNDYFHFGLLFSAFIPKQTFYIVATTEHTFTLFLPFTEFACSYPSFTTEHRLIRGLLHADTGMNRLVYPSVSGVVSCNF